MKVRFTLELDLGDVNPDDRGSVDHWICQDIADGDIHDASRSMDSDEFMKTYNLTWEEVPDAGNTNS